MEFERWQLLMKNLGISSNEPTYTALCEAYSEKHRRYHTSAHINATLKHLDASAHLAKEVYEIEIALWFHDGIYKPFSATNEHDSAIWASKFLLKNEVEADRVDRVCDLIMATVHTAEIENSDQLLMVDIDLSILGASQAIYRQFEEDVRYEYKLVPYFLYRKKRKEILSSFLNRDRIYNNNFFYSKLEAPARINLGNAISSL